MRHEQILTKFHDIRPGCLWRCDSNIMAFSIDNNCDAALINIHNRIVMLIDFDSYSCSMYIHVCVLGENFIRRIWKQTYCETFQDMLSMNGEHVCIDRKTFFGDCATK